MASAVHFGISEEKYRESPVIKLLSAKSTVRLLSLLMTTRLKEIIIVKIWTKDIIDLRILLLTIHWIDFPYRDKKLIVSVITIVVVMYWSHFSQWGLIVLEKLHPLIILYNSIYLTWRFSRDHSVLRTQSGHTVCYNWVQLCSLRGQYRRI